MAAHAAFTLTALWHGDDDFVSSGLFGGIFGQAALLGVWLAWGRGRGLWRMTGTAAGIFVLARAFDESLLEFLLALPITVVATAGAAVAIRMRTPLRSVDPAAPHAHRRPQYAIRHWLIGMAILGIWLAGLRAFVPIGSLGELALILLPLALSFAVVSIGALAAAMALNFVPFRLTLVAILAAALSLAFTAGLRLMFDNALVPRQLLEVFGHVLIAHLGAITVVAASLLALRAAGWRPDVPPARGGAPLPDEK